MKKVHLADRNGNLKEKYVGFSFAYLFLGPIYLLSRIRIFSALILIVFYFYFLPIPGMELLSTFITTNLPENLASTIKYILNLFRFDYIKYIGIGIVFIVQFITSFFIEGRLLRRSIKKHNYLPITEDDARLLISVKACNRKIPLADSRLNIHYDKINGVSVLYGVQKDVPYILLEKNKSEVARFKEAEKKKKLSELNDIYRLGQMKREEYEIYRAHIIKSYK